MRVYLVLAILEMIPSRGQSFETVFAQMHVHSSACVTSSP
jgi:hypothetical protein